MTKNLTQAIKRNLLSIVHCALCIASILFCSCSLDENPKDQITEEQAYTSADALFRNTVATLYNYIGGYTDGQGLQGTCRGVYDLQTFGSDEAMLPTRGGDWYDGGLWQAMYKHSWGAGHDLPKNAWVYLYKVVTLCNRSLEILAAHQSMAGDNYEAWQAEVRALRAMYYWYLIDLFGDVPLIESSEMAMNKVTRDARAKVWSFCVSELQQALPYLSYENSVRQGDYYGHITRSVALFVLAKLMLNHAVYIGANDDTYMQQTVVYCDQIAQLDFKLEDNYADNFAVNNGYSKENIFVIPMDKNMYSNQQQNLYRSYHYRHAAAYGFTGENGSCATLHTLSVFGYNTDEEDSRFRLNFFGGTVYDLKGNVVPDRTGKPLTYVPEAVEIDLNGSPYVEMAGARMKKYEVDKNAPKDGKLMDNDIVLFRYADVLLMRAEALLRTGKAAEGQPFFDAVRQRANMPTRPLTLQNIEEERQLELCWEGWRRQDMIRFGSYRSLYTGSDATDESDGHTRVFPIPADVRALNQNLTQNEGY